MDAFIAANTRIGHAPLVPEIALHLATEITPIWQATEAWLKQEGLSPPFWAFAWPGSQGIARYVLDNPALVVGRSVLDFATGGGLAAIACVMAGAGPVQATDIDPLAIRAADLNAALNGVTIDATCVDIVGAAPEWDLILCGDVCYEAPMTDHILPWLRHMARGAEVWIADPGRAYLPARGLTTLQTYDIPTSLELEDRASRRTLVSRLLPE